MLVKCTAFLALLTAVKAISITQPSETTKWNGGEATTITWNSVATDEETFNLAIKDKNNELKTIAEGVQTSSGSYSYTPDAGSDGEFNVQILSAKKTQSNAILAESGWFEIQAGSNANANTAASSSSASSAADDAASSATPSAGAAAASTSSGIPSKLTTPSANIQSAAASQTLSMSAGELQPSVQPSGGHIAPSGGNAAPSGAAPQDGKSGASAIVPSLALVGGSLLALLF